MKIDYPTLPFRPNLLLVENNTENLDVISYFLKDSADLDSALDGPSAIEKAAQKKYDIILMDINLGYGMNGVEATKRIRQIDGYDSIPIIAVTAYAMAGDKDIFLEAGCTHYISKPFTKKELLTLIADAFAVKS